MGTRSGDIDAAIEAIDAQIAQQIQLPPRVRHEDYVRHEVPPELYVPETY